LILRKTWFGAIVETGLKAIKECGESAYFIGIVLRI